VRLPDFWARESSVPGDADLELGLRSLGGDAYAAELRFLPPGGEAEAQLMGPPAPRVQLDPAALPGGLSSHGE
jgi:hypothetical protein